MSMVKAIIFDMDGVLIDTEPVYLERYKKLFQKNNQPVDDDFLKSTAGLSGKQRWKMIQEVWNEKITVAELRELYHKAYDATPIQFEQVVFPQVHEVLKELKNRGYRLALASSSTRNIIDTVLMTIGLQEYFEVVISGNQFKESKPNPEIYVKVLDELHLNAAECLVVEDSTYGICAAKNAGIKVAAIEDKRFSYEQGQADYLLKSLKDILTDCTLKFFS